jgi:hypothetical protein
MDKFIKAGFVLLFMALVSGWIHGSATSLITGKILRVDGVSHILQVDGVSRICRAGGC